MLWPWVILVIVAVIVGLWLVIRFFGEYQSTKREETKLAERVLAYKALRGWGTYSDPERQAFISGWLDQCFKPLTRPFPDADSEATLAAYQSGWVWSRERDTMMPNGRVEDVEEWR